MEIISIQQELDYLRLVEIEKEKSKRYFFNPDLITDFRDYILRISCEEVYRFSHYRGKDKWYFCSRF